MKLKRILAAFAAAALAAALVIPAGAAGAERRSSFTDVTDPATAVNADVLRLMGVVSGVGGDRFNPGGRLTRAEFCTMVVKFMQLGREVPLYASRTIFADVTARHWALPYVNLAASRTYQDGEQKIALIAGVGNGNFEPDREISLAEAATVLLHVLEYGSDKTGAAWPQSYMNLAGAIGLLEGMTADAREPISRAQAARLFVNALGCKNGAGARYFEGLGTARPNTVILAVGEPADDGSGSFAIRTAGEQGPAACLAAAGEVKPTALLGLKGTLVVNDRGEIVTFVPDRGEPVTVTLSGSAQPGWLKGTDGVRYTMNGGTLLYPAGALEPLPYSEGYTQLASGTQVTLYTERGRITAVYALGSAVSGGSTALVVRGPVSPALFRELTGGAEQYRILKNGVPVPMSELKEWDVASYDSLNRVLAVSDLRLACVYEDASPSPAAPTVLTALGHDFQVLDSAWEDTQQFRLGDRVVLLLTADGRVAGMARPGQAEGNALGLTGENSAQLFLPSGGSLALKGSLRGEADRLVRLSSDRKGELRADPLGSSGAPADFSLKDMRLGSHPVAPNVRAYEQSGSAVVGLSLSGLDLDVIPAEKVKLYHLNSAGAVDVVLTGSVSGDAYTYGLLRQGIVIQEDGELTATNRTVQVTGGSRGTEEMIASFDFEDGVYGGAVKGSGEIGGVPRAASVVVLRKLGNVKPSDFFVSRGSTYVRTPEGTFRVSEEVECRKTATGAWFTSETGAARLASCRAFSGSLTVYVDPIGAKVRVVTAD